MRELLETDGILNPLLYAKPRADHGAYIANWLSILRKDNRAIFTAAGHAARAAAFLQDLQPRAVRAAGSEADRSRREAGEAMMLPPAVPATDTAAPNAAIASSSRDDGLQAPRRDL
jgi:hypothetical protein